MRPPYGIRVEVKERIEEVGCTGLVGVEIGRDCIHVGQVAWVVDVIVVQVWQKETAVYELCGGSLRCIGAG